MKPIYAKKTQPKDFQGLTFWPCNVCNEDCLESEPKICGKFKCILSAVKCTTAKDCIYYGKEGCPFTDKEEVNKFFQTKRCKWHSDRVPIVWFNPPFGALMCAHCYREIQKAQFAQKHRLDYFPVRK
jgi:hypothetical protein